MVSLPEVPRGAQLLTVQQRVVYVALRHVRRRDAGRRQLHEGALFEALALGRLRTAAGGAARRHDPVRPLRASERTVGKRSPETGATAEPGAAGGVGQRARVREARGKPTERSVMGLSERRLPSSHTLD